MKLAPGRTPRGITRRTLLRSTAVGAAGLALGKAGAAKAQSGETVQSYVPQPGASQLSLRIATTLLSPDGGPVVQGVTANGTFPGPEIRLRRGDQLRIPVANGLAQSPTAIHWHGLLVPAGMDGVPDISNAPVPPGGIYVYEYPIRQSGTYWYHSHWGFQEQVGMAGPLIIEEPNEARADHDAVVMISDWMYASPEAVYAKLRGESAAKPAAKPMKGAMKMGGGGMDMGGMEMKGAAPKDAKAKDPMASDGGAMKMGGGADLSDIRYDAFLMNGKSTKAPWTLAAKPGEKIRLRFINAGASTYFKVRLDGHRMQVTHADGIAVAPVEVDHFLIGMAESYDVEVVLSGAGSYTLHAMAQDGSGQALGVLHTPDASPVADLAMPKFDDGRGLTYADLAATAPTTLPEGPARKYGLALGGDMKRYIWAINGQAYPKSDPLPIAQGERVSLVMKNTTMMWHPMHLHGHFFRVLQGAGERCPLKHTVNVAPGETVTVEFTADNPGRWFFHCHNLYHLEAGMARVFEYVA